MIDPKRIERLWEKEPALKSEHVYWVQDRGWFVCQRPNLRDPNDCPIPSVIAHALIRDRITTWLAKRQDARMDLVGLIFWMRDDEAYTLRAIIAAERVLGLEEWKE